MRNNGKVLAWIFLSLWCVLGSSTIHADNYKVYRGEGNTLEAYIALEKSNSFGLSMACSRGSKKTLELGVDIVVAENAKVSAEVGKLRKVPVGTKKDMDVCVNSRCKTYKWEDSGGEGCDNSGCPLRMFFSIDQSSEKKSISTTNCSQ